MPWPHYCPPVPPSSDIPTPDDDDLTITSLLGEAFHTSLRKSCDGGGSHEAWLAIKEMDREQWSNALRWTLWCLRESGYDVIKKDDKP